MANTNALIIGGVLFVGGILTIPFIIGLFCAPTGCLVMLIGLIIPEAASQHQVMYVPQTGYQQYQQPLQQYQQPPQQYQHSPQQYQQPPQQ